MSNPIFTGSGVAIVTPFNNNGIDFDKLGELIEWHIAEGTDAIVICGTTGEAPTMPLSEHQQAIAFTVEKVAKRIPVIAGTGSNDTQHSIQNTSFAYNAGVDAVLSVVPYYNKTSQKGLYEHFKTIASAVDVPMILYNVPSRTVLDMQPATVKRLSAIDNIVAIKECNFNHVGEILNMCGPDFAVYSGEDANVLPLLSLGGQGVISVMANIIPRDTHMICESFFKGDLATSRKIQLQALPLINHLFMEPSPGPVKMAMNRMGMNVGKCRLPLIDMEPDNIEALTSALKAYGLL